MVGKPCEAPPAPSAPRGAASAVEPHGGSAPTPRAPDAESATAGAAQAGAAEVQRRGVKDGEQEGKRVRGGERTARKGQG